MLTDNSRGNAPRIALLVAYLDDEYEWAICRSVIETVEARGGTVFCFAGAGLSDPDLARQARSRLFDLVHDSNVDAVLCISNVVGHYIGAGGIGAWLRRFRMPVSSIGLAEGVRHATTDDAGGIAQLVDHLVLAHGHQRIAFVTGNPTNAEAQTRLAAYADALRRHALPYAEDLILRGDFTRESGVRAVCDLFDTRQIPISRVDAILASNDYSALGVMDELARRRLRVPDQIAVVGFDDIALARHHDPPLTTARQRLDQLGRASAHQLLDVLEGRPGEESVRLDTELVLRRSCGCTPTDLPAALESTIEDPGTAPGSHFDQSEQTAVAIIDALANQLRGPTGAYLAALEPLLRRLSAGNALRFEESHGVFHELERRLRRSDEELTHERLHRLTRALQLRMFGPTARLSHVLAEFLPNLGVDECAISELVGEQELKLAFGFDLQNVEPQRVIFDARELIPPTLTRLRSRSAFIMPLTYGGQLLGVAALPVSHHDGAFYETLAETFSVALKSVAIQRSTRDG